MPLFEEFEKPFGQRYEKGSRHKDRPYTLLELRLLVQVLCHCRTQGEFYAACRAYCRATGRVPGVNPHACLTTVQYSRKCWNILRRRLWAVYTRYEGEVIVKVQDPCSGEGRRPLTFGEQFLLCQYHNLRLKRDTVLAANLVIFLGRNDSPLEVYDYLGKILPLGRIKDVPASMSSWTSVPALDEHLLEGLLRRLLLECPNPEDGLTVAVAVQRLHDFFAGKH
jgi:hypothetical protein